MATFPPALHASSRVNIEAWTEQAIEALSTVRISALTSLHGARGTSVALDIPLDDKYPVPVQRTSDNRDSAEVASFAAARAAYAQRREPLRRDSMKRREALLKGKEGSRRRQKWENDRLLGNPWMEPPTASDWDIRPTHPVHSVPYFLAPLWDERKTQAKMERAKQARKAGMPGQDQQHNLPKELREQLKRAKGAKGLLQDLEEQVREFLKMWDDRQKQLEQAGLADADSSEDEEIVFVGRNGQMRSPKSSEQKLEKDKLIFDSLVDDHGASFGRWLVHSIATHYNLRTWSVTTGNPARREAYVGIRETAARPNCSPISANGLPRPLWGMV